MRRQDAEAPRKNNGPRRDTKRHEWEERMDLHFHPFVSLGVPSWAILSLGPRRLGGAFSLHLRNLRDLTSASSVEPRFPVCVPGNSGIISVERSEYAFQQSIGHPART